MASRLPSKQLRKLLGRNRQRLGTGARESLVLAQLPKLQPAKPPRIDKPHLPAAGQGQPGMGMRNNGRVRSGHQKPPGHTQVNDPLSGPFGGCGVDFCLTFTPLSPSSQTICLPTRCTSRIDRAFEACGLLVRGAS